MPDVEEAHYRCMRCDHEWRQIPAQVVCPVCLNLYVEWVGYDAWAKRNPIRLMAR
jgi:Zn finger protein HypA/HybF involved in hydrogenase expression